MCNNCENNIGGIKDAWIEEITSGEDIHSQTIKLTDNEKNFLQVMRNTNTIAYIQDKDGNLGEPINMGSFNDWQLQEAEEDENFEKCAEIRDDIIDYKIKTQLLK